MVRVKENSVEKNERGGKSQAVLVQGPLGGKVLHSFEKNDAHRSGAPNMKRTDLTLKSKCSVA